MKIPKILEQIAQDFSYHDIKAILVGGSVRDSFLNLEVKDYDIEVYGVKSYEELTKLLQSYGKVFTVGKSFGVVKLKTDKYEFDFSLPRTETKVASGHKGFEVVCDAKLDFTTASKRRDFTINSIGYDIVQKKILDPYGGVEDLQNKLLKVVDKKTFIEDPLRVYRAMQFIARFELKLEPKTKELIMMMVQGGDLEELPKQRVFEEFKKLLLKADKPSLGLEFLKDVGALRYFPQLKALINTPQDKEYHPEGDVWIHTMKALDALKQKDLVLKFAVLCHDMGKPDTTAFVDGRIRSRGHEEVGVEIAQDFLKILTDDKKLISQVLPLVRYHYAPSALYKQNSKNKAIRRLSTKVNIEQLVKVAKADFLGRDTPEAKSGIYKAGEWLLQKAKELKVENKPPSPLITGKDLINIGLSPSPQFKKILDEVYQKQLDDGVRIEELLDYLKKIIIK